jgi:hypothetical protein
MTAPTLRGKFTVKPPHPMKLFCLSWGGHTYVPTISSQLLLIDRNLFSKLAAVKAPICPAEAYWLDVFKDVSQRINPIMVALEGANRRQPSLEEFQQELTSTRDCLAALYPDKEIISHSSEMSEMLFGEMKRKKARQIEEAAFLQEWAPRVVDRLSDHKLMPRIRELLGAATEAGLHKSSLAHVALLSCLAEDRHGEASSPGRMLIKPRREYTLGDAHNALSDVHSLEWLIQARAGEFDDVVFCTMDRGLAEFWLGLKVSRSERNGEFSTTFRFSIQGKLCPRLSDEQLEEVAALI